MVSCFKKNKSRSCLWCIC